MCWSGCLAEARTKQKCITNIDRLKSKTGFHMLCSASDHQCFVLGYFFNITRKDTKSKLAALNDSFLWYHSYFMLDKMIIWYQYTIVTTCFARREENDRTVLLVRCVFPRYIHRTDPPTPCKWHVVGNVMLFVVRQDRCRKIDFHKIGVLKLWQPSNK